MNDFDSLTSQYIRKIFNTDGKTGQKPSVAKRVIFCIVIGISILVVASLVIMRSSVQREFNGYINELMVQKEELLNYRLEKQKNEMINAAKIVAETIGGDTWSAYSEDHALMQDMVNSMFETYNYVDCLKVYGYSGKEILASRDALNFEITDAVIQKAQNSEPRYDILKHGAETVKLCGYPIFDEEKSFVGIVLLAGFMSDKTTLEQIKSNTDCEVAIFDGYTQHRTTFDKTEGVKLEKTEIIDNVMKGKSVVNTLKIGGQIYSALYAPLLNAENLPVTTIFLGLNVNNRDNLISKLLKIIIPAIAIIASIIILVLYFILFKRHL